MLERLGGTQASIDELMHETGVAVAEQLLMLSVQELGKAKQCGRNVGHVPDDPGLWSEFDLPANIRTLRPTFSLIVAVRPRLEPTGRCRHSGAPCRRARRRRPPFVEHRLARGA